MIIKCAKDISSTATRNPISMQLALDSNYYLSIFLNQIAKKSYSAFKALTTYFISTTRMYDDSFALIVVMMIISMMSFSDQLNCFCELC
jgi:hypothetical protein